MKFSRRCANPFFSFCRLGTLAPSARVDSPRFGAGRYGNIPVTDLFAVTQRSMRKREPDTIVSKTEILCRFGHAIWREPLWKAGIVPVGVEHERRTHHHSAASIVPLLLLACSTKTARVNQRDLTPKLNPPFKTSFQFRPRRLGPETPT